MTSKRGSDWAYFAKKEGRILVHLGYDMFLSLDKGERNCDVKHNVEWRSVLIDESIS